MDNHAWLNCKVSPGQFSEEYAVRAFDYTNNEFSLFVNQSFVQVDHQDGSAEGDGRLEVIVLKVQDGLSLVRLPGRTFANGSTVTVQSGQLATSEPVHT